MQHDAIVLQHTTVLFRPLRPRAGAKSPNIRQEPRNQYVPSGRNVVFSLAFSASTACFSERPKYRAPLFSGACIITGYACQKLTSSCITARNLRAPIPHCPPHHSSRLPDVFRLHDEATLLVGRVPRRRVGDGHGGTIRAEGRQNAIGRLHRQAEGAVRRKVRLKTTLFYV